MDISLISTKSKAFFRKHKHFLLLFGIFGVGILTYTAIVILNHRAINTDDVIFPEQILPYPTMVDWVIYRYHEWSGRIFSEAFVYIFAKLPFFIWQFISVAMYATSSVFLFLFYRLFSTTRSQSKDYVMAIAALGLPFLMHTAVMSDGFIWMTGSIVYAWMTTLALVALYPLFFYAKTGRLPNIAFLLVGLVAIIISAPSQEQVGAVLVGLVTLLLGYTLYAWAKKQRSRFPWYLVFIFIVVVAVFAISVLAPGNKIRIDQELIRWLPDFYTTAPLERANYSYRWLIDAFVNHTGFLLVLIWSFMAALLAKKPHIKLLDKAVVSSLVLLVTIIIARGIEAFSQLFDFKATWKPDLANTLLSLNVVPWGIVLILTAFVPLLIFKKKMIGYILVTLFFASFAAAAVITLSPTLYASGWRSMFVSSMILVVISYVLLDKTLDLYSKQSYIFAATIICLALAQSAYQAAHLIKTVS